MLTSVQSCLTFVFKVLLRLFSACLCFACMLSGHCVFTVSVCITVVN